MTANSAVSRNIQPHAAPLRILFMGTPEFAAPTLRALLDAQEAQGWRVVGVATQPDRPAGRRRKLTPSPVKEVAVAHGLPLHQPERLRNNPEAVATLTAAMPDVIVVAAYGLILPKSVLAIPRFGCINVHASLLPALRGASPIAGAILHGEPETGISIMLMDEGLDTGPVLAQRATPIHAGDTTATLTPRLAELGANLLVETLGPYTRGEIRPVAQDELPGAPSLCGRIRKSDGHIDWTRPAAHIERMVRAYTPWPGAYTLWQDAPLRILRAQVEASGAAGRQSAAPGTVLRLEPAAQIGIATGDGLLIPLEIQPAGKRPMDMRSFLNGAAGFVGSVLPSAPTGAQHPNSP